MGEAQGLLLAPWVPSESSSASASMWAGLCTVLLGGLTKRCSETRSHYPGCSHECNKVGGMEEKGKRLRAGLTGRKAANR